MLITLWDGIIDARLNAPPPKLMTTDGEELTPIEDTFDIVGIDDNDGAPTT